MYFGYNRLLDALDQYLCHLNPARHRSLFLHRTFYTNLHLHKDRKISRAYKKHVVNENIRPDFSFFDLDKVFIPVYDSSHFTMYVIFPRRKHLVFYDSLNLKEPANLLPQDILDYVENECAAADLQYRPS
jgi:Ulp1 family protease